MAITRIFNFQNLYDLIYYLITGVSLTHKFLNLINISEYLFITLQFLSFISQFILDFYLFYPLSFIINLIIFIVICDFNVIVSHIKFSFDLLHKVTYSVYLLYYI